MATTVRLLGHVNGLVEVFDPPKDGDCLFAALGSFSQTDAGTMRDAIVGALRDPAVFPPDVREVILVEFPELSWEAYCDRMAIKAQNDTPGTWGGEPELVAYCTLFRRRVVVLTSFETLLVEPRGGMPLPADTPLDVVGRVELHYTAFGPRDDDSGDQLVRFIQGSPRSWLSGPRGAAIIGAGAGAGKRKRSEGESELEGESVEGTDLWNEGVPSEVEVPMWASIPRDFATQKENYTFVNRTSEVESIAWNCVENMAYAYLSRKSGDRADNRPVACAMHAYGAGKTALGSNFVSSFTAGEAGSAAALVRARIDNQRWEGDLKAQAHLWLNVADAVSFRLDISRLVTKTFLSAVLSLQERLAAAAGAPAPGAPAPQSEVVFVRHLRTLLKEKAVFIFVDEVGHFNNVEEAKELRDWLSSNAHEVFAADFEGNAAPLSPTLPTHGLFIYMCGRTHWEVNKVADISPSFTLFNRITLESLRPEHVRQIMVARSLDFGEDSERVTEAVIVATAGIPLHVQRLLSVLAAVGVGSHFVALRQASVEEQVSSIATAYAKHQTLGAEYLTLMQGPYANALARRTVQCILGTRLGGATTALQAERAEAQLQTQYMPFSLQPVHGTDVASVHAQYTVRVNLVFMRAVHGRFWRWMLRRLALQYFPLYGDDADAREIDVYVAMLRVLVPSASLQPPDRFSQPGFAVPGVALLALVDKLLPEAERELLTGAGIVLPPLRLQLCDIVGPTTFVGLQAAGVAEAGGDANGVGFVCRPQAHAECADVFVWLNRAAGAFPRVLEFQVKAYQRSQLGPAEVQKELKKCIKVTSGVPAGVAGSVLDCAVWHFLVADRLGATLEAAVQEAGGCLVLRSRQSRKLGKTVIKVPAGVALFIPHPTQFKSWQPPRVPPPVDAVGVRKKARHE
eukprot:c20715_g3_i2.p1 GENE.c20715_g3_i2~~c20715_g3_i2.p1  ORF type:complete len:910 (-),score=103.31 c20715_g3_i2:73-2802(-)